MAQAWRLLIDKDHIERAELDEDPAEAAALAGGGISVALTRCGLTANNVTYAALGKSFKAVSADVGYWGFFPSGQEGHGLLPVWGFATVEESRSPEIAIGEELYGFFPLAARTTMTPAGVSATGLTDASTHRQPLATIYNGYVRLAGLPPIPEEEKNLWAVYRSLLMTGYMIADQFEDDGFYGAERIIIASASSKTALMTAYCFRRLANCPPLIGLTSKANVGYVRGSALYDDVMTYDDIDSAENATPAAFIDIAGNSDVTSRLHDRLADRLTFSLRVGMSHWQATGGAPPRAGPRVAGFFAPERIKKRSAEWGGDGFRARTTAAWTGFLSIAPNLARITVLTGPDAARHAYRTLVAGDVDPNEALVLTF